MTDLFMKSVQVKLEDDSPSDRSYAIDIEAGLWKRVPLMLTHLFPKRSWAVVTTAPIAKLYSSKLKSLAALSPLNKLIVLPDGEKYKTLQTLEKIYTALIKVRADRKTALIVVGGGVVGDIGGFAAASYLRGIPFVQIPTTLLAQVDSSVGGKTGVDLPQGKNLVGAFYQPKWVAIDLDFLKTLPQREFLCGLAEVVKYGVIWDEKFFSYLENNVGNILKKKSETLEHIIERSCAIKAEVVSKDEREGGLRAILNFGHTLGHAIETLSGYKAIKHGEAVSRGMMFASKLSSARGLCGDAVSERLKSLLQSLGLPVTWPDFKKSQYARVMAIDKKASHGKINFVAVKSIGEVILLPLTSEEVAHYV